METQVIENAERVLSIALKRWKGEYDDAIPYGTEGHISMFVATDVSHCLLAFRIDGIRRTSIDKHQAPKPITDLFEADVTLTITPRPSAKMKIAEMRAAAVDPEIVSDRYAIKHFVDGGWLIIAESVLGNEESQQDGA